MHSAIYHGQLRHRRFHPRNHEFTYSSTLFYIDLDELPLLFSHTRGWSLDRSTPGCFRREDYLDPEESCLKTAVRNEVRRQTGFCPEGAVRLLTNLRMWGMCFNPVSFYYVFAPDSETPALILAQVNNTPWNKRHCYVIQCDPATGKAQQEFTKEFHVSPFNPLQMDYKWASTNPAETLAVHMENHAANICHMDATLTLKREPWSAAGLQKILWRQPWLTIKVPVAIYWQALKLLLKRIPIYSHKEISTSLAGVPLNGCANNKDLELQSVTENNRTGLRSHE